MSYAEALEMLLNPRNYLEYQWALERVIAELEK